MNAPTPAPMKEKEVVLPSGAYCHVRALTGRDLLQAQKLCDAHDYNLIFVLATLCCKIDDKQLLYEQLLDMDLRDVVVLQREVNTYLIGPIK